MTGLEKIIQEIQQEAAAEAAAVTEKANADAAEILRKAREEADALTAKSRADADAQVADIEAARDSAMVLQRRQQTLQAKQEVLAETLEKALQTLYDLPEKEYFELLAKLAGAAAQPGQGMMLLCEKDKQRLPTFFKLELVNALGNGKRLHVADETRPIDGGFVLKYGDIEENCSFRAMFDARQDEFSDLIRPTLFD